jgi:hypothetical protein
MAAIEAGQLLGPHLVIASSKTGSGEKNLIMTPELSSAADHLSSAWHGVKDISQCDHVTSLSR